MQHSGFTLPAALAKFHELSDAAFVDDKVLAALLQRSRTSIWRDAKAGRLPAPIRLGPACTRWNVGAIRRHLAALSVGSE